MTASDHDNVGDNGVVTKVAGKVVVQRSLGGRGVSLLTQCCLRTAAGGGWPRGEPSLGPPLHHL